LAAPTGRRTLFFGRLALASGQRHHRLILITRPIPLRLGLLDNEELLKARSVELAERSKRLIERTNDTNTKSNLGDCAAELIRLDNSNRFDSAQKALEQSVQWSEAERSLAHEIHSAEQMQNNTLAMSFDEVIQILDNWSRSYITSAHPEINIAGQNLYRALQQLVVPEERSTQKAALNYLMELFEVLLAHIGTKKDEVDNKSILTVRQLRRMRDAVLVTRELDIDDPELLDNQSRENLQFDSVTTARDALDEIYKNIVPVILP